MPRRTVRAFRRLAWWYAVLSSLIAASVARGTLPGPAEDVRPLVYNGVEYDPKEFPSVVCLVTFKADAGYGTCTGVMIKPLFALSGAHCQAGYEPKDNLPEAMRVSE